MCTVPLRKIMLRKVKKYISLMPVMLGSFLLETLKIKLNDIKILILKSNLVKYRRFLDFFNLAQKKLDPEGMAGMSSLSLPSSSFLWALRVKILS